MNVRETSIEMILKNSVSYNQSCEVSMSPSLSFSSFLPFFLPFPLSSFLSLFFSQALQTDQRTGIFDYRKMFDCTISTHKSSSLCEDHSST